MKEKKHAPLTPVRIAIIVYFALLILLLTAIGIFSYCGYSLIQSGVSYVLFGLLICSALAALAVFIVRHVKRPFVKKLLIALSVIVVAGVGLILINFFSFMDVYGSPHEYTTLVSPTGERAVVLYTFSLDEEKMQARAALRRQNDPEADPEELQTEDIGKVYVAYPRTLGIFYLSKKPSTGSVEIGLGSSGKLMYEWLDAGKTLRMYVENSEVCDSGELKLTIE